MKNNKHLQNFQNILIQEKNGTIKAEGGVCFGSYFPIMRENVLLNEYKQQIKEQIKYLRDYPTGKNQKSEDIEISGLYSPAILEYTPQFNSAILSRTGWNIQKYGSFHPQLKIEIPYSTAQQIHETSLTSYIEKIDNKIKSTIQEKQNSLIGKIKRFSTKDIEFPELKKEIKYNHPKIKTFYNKGADVVSGTWNPDAENWRLD